MSAYTPLFAKGARSKAPWFRIEARGPDAAEVSIYDEIGLWGITAKDFCAELGKVKAKSITLRLNSPGGSVFDGLAIYNALKRHPACVTAHVDGIAASIASIIALAGDALHMGEGSFFMIHDPSVLAVGTAADLRANADLLDKLAGEMVTIYADRTGMSAEDTRAAMLAETWYTAEEAVAAGFASEVHTGATAHAAGWDLSVYRNVPTAVLAQNTKRAPANERELEAILRDAGLSRTRAAAVVSGGWKTLETPRDAAAHTDATTHTQTKTEEHPMPDNTFDAAAIAAEARRAEQTRVTEILAITRNHPEAAELATQTIANGGSVADFMRAVLAKAPVLTPIVPPGPAVTVEPPNERLKPWDSFGQQLLAVAGHQRPNGKTDPRLFRAASGANEAVGSEGGFLVDPQFTAGLLDELYEADPIVSKCTKIGIGAGKNGIRAYGIDETSRATGSRYGGVQTYWAAEAATVTATKPKFREINMTLDKLMSIFYATDELLEDSTALESMVRPAFSGDMAFMVADGVINGSGAGSMLGILNAGVTVSVTKETGQIADTVLYENVSKMWARCRARNRANAVWLINQEVEPQLQQMYLALGTAGVPVYLPSNGISGTPFATLFGRPVIPAEQCSALGDVGDIILCDLSDYLIIDKGGVKSDVSIHVRFLYDESTYRFTYRVNGQPLRATPVTPFKGTNTLSPFVTLAAR